MRSVFTFAFHEPVELRIWTWIRRKTKNIQTKILHEKIVYN